jgi:hypothetical protein
VWDVSTRFRLQIAMILRCEQSFGTPQGFKTTVRLENEAFLGVIRFLKPFRLAGALLIVAVEPNGEMSYEAAATECG